MCGKHTGHHHGNFLQGVVLILKVLCVSSGKHTGHHRWHWLQILMHLFGLACFRLCSSFALSSALSLLLPLPPFAFLRFGVDLSELAFFFLLELPLPELSSFLLFLALSFRVVLFPPPLPPAPAFERALAFSSACFLRSALAVLFASNVKQASGTFASLEKVQAVLFDCLYGIGNEFVSSNSTINLFPLELETGLSFTTPVAYSWSPQLMSQTYTVSSTSGRRSETPVLLGVAAAGEGVSATFAQASLTLASSADWRRGLIVGSVMIQQVTRGCSGLALTHNCA
jgi:hypothetical protein